MSRLVVVLTMGRSGSSMVAGALALHGMWTGVCRPADKHNARGYFENLRLGRAIGRHYQRQGRAASGRGSIYNDLRPMTPPARWPEFVHAVQRAEGWRGGLALVKSNVFTWPIWLPMEPLFVNVMREPEDVVRSALRHDPLAGFSADGWRRVVLAHQQEQRRVHANFGGYVVNSDRVVVGDFSELEEVTENLGVPFQNKQVTSFVEPALWHG